MRVRFLFAAATAVILTSASAQAQGIASANTGDRGHQHLGFFIRPDAGYGYMSTSGGGTTIGRSAFLGSLHIGGAIAENLILGADLYAGGTAKHVSFSINGQPPPLSDGSIALAGIGPELTYYLMPSNVYVSATVGVTSLRITAPDQDSGSRHGGFGGRIGIGKEWWVSSHWGLGVVCHASQSWNSVDSVTFSTWSLGAAFSATYN